jgi:hypothetical protein
MLACALAKISMPDGGTSVVGQMAIGDNGLAVGAVVIHRVNAIAAQFEKEQSAGAGRA